MDGRVDRYRCGQAQIRHGLPPIISRDWAVKYDTDTGTIRMDEATEADDWDSLTRCVKCEQANLLNAAGRQQYIKAGGFTTKTYVCPNCLAKMWAANDWRLKLMEDTDVEAEEETKESNAGRPDFDGDFAINYGNWDFDSIPACNCETCVLATEKGYQPDPAHPLYYKIGKRARYYSGRKSDSASAVLLTTSGSSTIATETKGYKWARGLIPVLVQNKDADESKQKLLMQKYQSESRKAKTELAQHKSEMNRIAQMKETMKAWLDHHHPRGWPPERCDACKALMAMVEGFYNVVRTPEPPPGSPEASGSRLDFVADEVLNSMDQENGE